MIGTYIIGSRVSSLEFLICLKSNLHFIALTLGTEEVPEEFKGPVMKKLIEHTRNNDKESRIQQPDLPVYW